VVFLDAEPVPVARISNREDVLKAFEDFARRPKDKSFQTSAGADATRKSIMAKSFHLTVSSGKGRTDSHLKVVAATVPV